MKNADGRDNGGHAADDRDGVCTAGFRKHHERADPQCRLHGSSSRGTRPARPQVPALRQEEEPQPAGGQQEKASSMR